MEAPKAGPLMWVAKNSRLGRLVKLPPGQEPPQNKCRFVPQITGKPSTIFIQVLQNSGAPHRHFEKGPSNCGHSIANGQVEDAVTLDGGKTFLGVVQNFLDQAKWDRVLTQRLQFSYLRTYIYIYIHIYIYIYIYVFNTHVICQLYMLHLRRSVIRGGSLRVQNTCFGILQLVGSSTFARRLPESASGILTGRQMLGFLLSVSLQTHGF